MVTIRASPPDQSPRTSYCTIVLFGSQVISLVRLTGLPAFNSVHPRRIRCRSQHRGMGYHPLWMKIRWGCPLGCCHQLTAMLARAAMSIGLEVNRLPSPEPSRLDDWFLGAGRGSQPRSAPVLFFPEVHEELTKSWMGPFTARSRSSPSSVLTTLDV